MQNRSSLTLKEYITSYTYCKRLRSTESLTTLRNLSQSRLLVDSKTHLEGFKLLFNQLNSKEQQISTLPLDTPISQSQRQSTESKKALKDVSDEKGFEDEKLSKKSQQKLKQLKVFLRRHVSEHIFTIHNRILSQLLLIFKLEIDRLAFQVDSLAKALQSAYGPKGVTKNGQIDIRAPLQTNVNAYPASLVDVAQLSIPNTCDAEPSIARQLHEYRNHSHNNILNSQKKISNYGNRGQTSLEKGKVQEKEKNVSKRLYTEPAINQEPRLKYDQGQLQYTGFWRNKEEMKCFHKNLRFVDGFKKCVQESKPLASRPVKKESANQYRKKIQKEIRTQQSCLEERDRKKSPRLITRHPGKIYAMQKLTIGPLPSDISWNTNQENFNDLNQPQTDFNHTSQISEQLYTRLDELLSNTESHLVIE